MLFPKSGLVVLLPRIGKAKLRQNFDQDAKVIEKQWLLEQT
jgi:hypothetical protein